MLVSLFYFLYILLIMLYILIDEMNIIPATKGIIGGKIRFRFHLVDQYKQSASTLDTGFPVTASDINMSAWYDCISSGIASDGVVISHLWSSRKDDEVEIEITSDVRCVMVIEKEGVFHRLCEDRFYM